MNTDDVLAELDDVIAGLKFGGNKSDAAELESIRTRIAALVEAAKVFDVEVDPETAGDYQILFVVSAKDIRALAEALRGIGR